MSFFQIIKGLLHAKLDHLYAKCAAENSPIFQSYMVRTLQLKRISEANGLGCGR